MLRMHHTRHKNNTGSDGQHSVIGNDIGIDKRLPKAFVAENQQQNGGDKRKRRQSIDKTVKARAVQIGKRRAADAHKTLRTLGEEDKKISEEKP